jgi:hypothetical protein
MRLKYLVAAFCASLLFFAGCKKQTDDFTLPSLAQYVLNQPGKFIIYRTDSTVYTNFGSREETRYYQEKHQVDAQFMDATGRPSFRVFRFLRDSGGTTPWMPMGSFVITPTQRNVEIIEDNLRILKLAAPLSTGHSWLGNQFLPEEPYRNLFEFSNDNDMRSWSFSYENVNEPELISGRILDSVVTVTQIADSLSGPQFGYRNFGTEQYAKGVGLVHQELVMWEFQVVPTPNRKGFGIKRTMIAHN